MELRKENKMSENRIVTKKPPYKESIGSQYYVFNNPNEGNDFDTTKYEDDVVKTDTVKSVTITENTENTPIYGSGVVYDTRNQLAYVDIAVESIANDADDLNRMRGDETKANGLIQGKTQGKRPFFAYGKVVKLSNGNVRYDWYPKCQLIENSDETKTRTENFEEQNETLTIRAYAFDEKGEIFKNSIDSTTSKFPTGVTEELFFKKPIITEEDLTAIIPQGA